MTIGEKITHLRIVNNISQEELAKQLDVSRQSVSKWESGESLPQIDKVLELIKEYNPICISNKDFQINNIDVSKVKLDITKIIEYYNNKPAINPHLVVPDYLKLPQAMETKNDNRN